MLDSSYFIFLAGKPPLGVWIRFRAFGLAPATKADISGGMREEEGIRSGDLLLVSLLHHEATVEKGGKDLPTSTPVGNHLIITREILKNGEDIPACASHLPSIFNHSILYALGNKIVTCFIVVVWN